MLIENLNKSKQFQFELTSDHPSAEHSQFYNIERACENLTVNIYFTLSDLDVTIYERKIQLHVIK